MIPEPKSPPSQGPEPKSPPSPGAGAEGPPSQVPEPKSPPRRGRAKPPPGQGRGEPRPASRTWVVFPAPSVPPRKLEGEEELLLTGSEASTAQFRPRPV